MPPLAPPDPRAPPDAPRIVPRADLLARFDADGRHLSASAAYCAWIGRPPADLLGRRHAEVGLAPAVVRQWARALSDAVASGAPVGFALGGEAGAPPTPCLEFHLWVEPDASAPTVVHAVGRDVTAARGALAASQAAATRYRTLVEAVSQAVWRAGPQGELVADNRAWLDYTAQYVDGASHSPLLWLAEVHPEDRGRTEAAWRAAVRSGEPYRASYRLRRHDGSWQAVIAFGVPVRDAAGQVVEWVGTVRDLVARAEDAPGAPDRADLQTVVERLAGVGSWELDLADDRVRWSDEMRRILGMGDGDAPSLETLMARIHPDDLAGMRRRMGAALAAGQETPLEEFRIRHPDGEERIIEGRARPVLGPDGRPRYVIGTGQDVTERRRTERSVAESALRLRALVEATAQIVWRLEADGACHDEFGTIARFTGLHAPAASPDGRTDWWLDAVHPDDRAHTLGALAAAFATGTPYSIVHRVRRHDGEWRDMEVRCVPVRAADGAIREWIGAHVDVTDVTRARQALDEARRLRDALIDQVPDALWLKSTDGRVLVANAAFGAMLGRPAASVIGATDAELFPPEVAARFAEDDRAALASDGPVEVEQEIRGADGVMRILETVKVALRDATGRAIGTVGAARDVTGRRALEEQLRHAQKLEALGLLAGSVAHDFNNLLTAILGSAELARLEVPDASPAALDLDEVERTTRRATALTRQLLAFSRRQVPQARAVDLGDLVQELEPLLRRLLPEAVGLDLAPAPCVVRADPGQLEQVVMNLVLNARDAIAARVAERCPPGGVAVPPPDGPPATGTIGVTVEPAVADDVRARAGLPPGRYVALRVHDDGVGMDAATRARLFEPFFTTKPVGEGTGLGLTVVFGIVSQAGGAVLVDSVPGEETTFTVLLPVLDAPAEQWSGAAPTHPGGTETILLVEDEGVVRALARRILERHGYRVIEARHGGDALLAWRTHGPAIDLLITDLRMPELDGEGLVARLRAERPSLPVLLVSGYADAPERWGAARRDGDVFLAKPFTSEALLVHVRQALAAR